MKRLIFSFWALLLGCSLAWAQTVTISGTIKMEDGSNLPSGLYLALGKLDKSLIGAEWYPNNTGSYSISNVYSGTTVNFYLSENGEYPTYSPSSAYVFVDGDAVSNPLSFEVPASGDVTKNLVVRPAGSGGAKGSLVGTANYEGNSSTCAYGITVAISGGSYSKSTSTEYGDAYYDKLGCSYGYEFKDLEVGTEYTLTYSKYGYETQTQKITLAEAGETIAPTVTLSGLPEEYEFHGYISYLDADNTSVSVEGAKITAYDGSGADAAVLGTPVYTDANGYWSMTLECKSGASVYFFAEHPNIVVTNRVFQQAYSTGGLNVNISCTEKLPDLLGFETYKLKQKGTVSQPQVEISWTWPQALIDNYKTSADDKEGLYKINEIKIKRPNGMAGTVQVGSVVPSGYELPATSYIDGIEYTLEIGKTYTYSIEIVYAIPFGNVAVTNGDDNRLKITLTSALAAPDSVTLTLVPNDAAMGTVSGAGKYEKGDQVMIHAKANKGYLFKEWQKGGQTYATAADYKATLTEDMTLTAVFEERPPIKDSVTITLTPNDATMGTVAGGGRYAKGEEITIEATPKAGYAFKQWKSGNIILSSKKVHTFIANTDSTITAVFQREIVYRAMINCKAKQISATEVRLNWEWPQALKDDYLKADGSGIYSISQINIMRRAEGQTTNATSAGTVRPNAYTLPPTSYIDKSTEERPLEVGATYNYYLEVYYEKPDYKTVTVNNDGSDENLSVTMEVDVVSDPRYTLTLLSNDNEMGSVSATPANSQYFEGDEVTVTATPKPGYLFQCWKEGDEVVYKAATYPFTITANRTLTAVFVPATAVTKVTLTLTVNDEARGSVSGGGEFAQGTLVSATASPKAGYVFQCWKEGDQEVDDKLVYTFEITEDRTLEAVFVSKQAGDETEVTVSLEVNNATMGTVSGGGKYAKGSEVTVTATANDGYLFRGWEENGQMLPGVGAIYKFMANADRTLKAVFSDSVDVTLNVNNAAWGTVTGAGRYKIGTEVTVKATPKKGYTFQSWTVGQTVVFTEAEYKLTVYSDTTLKAMFAVAEMVTLTLDVNDEKMGTVSGAGEYEKGSKVTVTATPNKDCEFRAWKEGDEEVSTDAEYTFVLNENRALTAVFAMSSGIGDLVTLTLDVNDEVMGTVSGAGKYKKGTEVTVTATANKGYVFRAWKQGEEVVSTEAEYTFVMEADLTLTAVFVEGDANEYVELAAWDVFAENGHIVLRSNTDCRYEVYTVGGILVKQGIMNTNACSIAVDHNGLYIVRRISSTGISAKKIVVR